MKNFLNKFPDRYYLLLLIFILPVSSSYQLNEYGINSGSEINNSSSNFSGNSSVGDLSGDKASSTNYSASSGLVGNFQANTPTAPTFTNPSSYYDKLKIVIDTGSNPTDTKFAVAISTDNFTTTSYVKSDNTVGSTLTATDGSE